MVQFLLALPSNTENVVVQGDRTHPLLQKFMRLGVWPQIRAEDFCVYCQLNRKPQWKTEETGFRRN